MDPGLDAVRALHGKYVEIRALRIEHAQGELEDPRPRLRALARRFPGALRELDELPMDVIEERLAALVAALTAGPPFAQWIALQVGYHAWMRAALRVKRLARGRRGSALDEVLRELAASEPAQGEARLAPDAVAVVLDPPGGRLGPWVLAQVATAAGVEPDTVRKALFLRAR